MHWGCGLKKFFNDNPDAKGVILESHGLFTWADDAKECYELTLTIINRAIDFFEGETRGKPAFGGAVHDALATDARRAVAARLMPAIRGLVSGSQHMVGHFDDSDAVLEFVNARDMPDLAALRTSCPDHFLRTKIRPLVVDFDPARENLDQVLAGLSDQIATYRDDYAAYYDRFKRADGPAMRDPTPWSIWYRAWA